jgi:hypothetical protein
VMKKLVLLALVLGMASIASATLTLIPGSGGEITINTNQVLTIQVSDTATAQEGKLSYVIVEEGGVGALSDAVALPEAGELGGTNPYSYAGWGAGFELASGSAQQPGTLVPGVQFTVDFMSAAQGTAIVSLWDGGGSYQAADDYVTVNVVPEPMTLALLGLGGLLLRHKK